MYNHIMLVIDNFSCHFLFFSKTVSPPRSSAKPKVVHEPAACAPVCSDPTSFEKPAAKISKDTDITGMTNEEIVKLVLGLQIKDHELEKRLDPFRAVTVRRLIAQIKLQSVHNVSKEE